MTSSQQNRCRLHLSPAHLVETGRVVVQSALAAGVFALMVLGLTACFGLSLLLSVLTAIPAAFRSRSRSAQR